MSQLPIDRSQLTPGNIVSTITENNEENRTIHSDSIVNPSVRQVSTNSFSIRSHSHSSINGLRRRRSIHRSDLQIFASFDHQNLNTPSPYRNPISQFINFNFSSRSFSPLFNSLFDDSSSNSILLSEEEQRAKELVYLKEAQKKICISTLDEKEPRQVEIIEGQNNQEIEEANVVMIGEFIRLRNLATKAGLLPEILPEDDKEIDRIFQLFVSNNYISSNEIELYRNFFFPRK